MTCASEKDNPQHRIPEWSFNELLISLVVILLLGSMVVEEQIAYLLHSETTLADGKPVRVAPVGRMGSCWSPADPFCDSSPLPPILFTKSQTLKDI